jgi:hypothetical protein
MNNNGSYNLSFPQNATILVNKNGGSTMNVSKSIMQTINRTALAVVFCLLTLTSVFALTNETHNLSLNTNKVNKLFTPSATFKDIWIDYDVTEGGQDGMRIHVKFSVYQMKNLDSYLAIYFLDSNGDKLRDNNDKFNSSSGDVAVYFALKPGYATTDYSDLSVFMPYDELDLGAGKWNLRLDVDVIYKGGGLIQHLTYKDFEYTQDDDTGTNTKGSVSATVKRIWVDYDVSEDGRKGMRIHVNFEVNGLKGIDSKIVARVQKENGDYLTSSSAYSNDSGQLETSFDMKPGFSTTVYEDATMFLPYNEIMVRKGVWTLKLDIDLNYENGDLIDHLDYHEFDFTKP